MIVEITRLREIGGGYWGIMLIDNIPRYSTLELPWRDNKTDISCIPTSKTYTLERVQSPKFGTCYDIYVKGRENILIHPGNYIKDTTGCVLIGTGYEMKAGEPTITNSKKAFDDFMRRADGRKFMSLFIR